MLSRIQLRLNAHPTQLDSLTRLQKEFSEACNVLAPVVREQQCWNRVGLHHLAYRKLREVFPSLGSQMACNAIYSVCRSARLIYQGANSPWNIEKTPGRALPLLKFAANAPVYFDRHTLSLRQGKLSMYTLEGRLRFDVSLTEEGERCFREDKLKEVILTRDAQGYFLSFTFGNTVDDTRQELPEYLVVVESAA